MFIDKKRWDQNQSGGDDDYKWSLIFFGIFSLALIIIIVTVFFLVRSFSDNNGRDKRKVATSTPATSTNPGSTTSTQHGLPDNDDDNGGQTGLQSSITTLKAEKLQFGDFYDSPAYNVNATSAIGYDIPLNVKTDVANYYDVARKVGLENEVPYLNQNGFTVISNPYSGKADNFYGLYKKLKQKEIPLILTKDFLQYYYQNVMKKNFKEIESGIFYENLWDINSALYDSAKLRYEKLSNSTGMSSDPYLQAARMEVAYFATALKLLEPRKNQISYSELSNETKFSPDEVRDFSIDLPKYLQDDVPDEIELIRNSRKENVRSPVLFYKRNYREFQVPENYKDSARLTNFYLASQWLNSVFPLYYKSDSCSGCKLDKADWRINMLTSCLIARDFVNNQDIKNKWAQVYKVISYFRGLRDEFTYLDYIKRLNDVLGKDYKLKDTFLDKDLEKIDEKLTFLRNELVSNFYFSQLEGAYDHTSTSGRPKVGLRVLSQPYTPNKYIFKNLIYPKVGGHLRGSNPDTYCRKDNLRVRCKAMSQDVTNLFYPTPEDDKYFARNTDYRGYDEQVGEIKNQLDDFGDYTWHSSNYWTVVDMINNSLRSSVEKIPAFQTKAWKKRNIKFFLGSLVNIQLSADKIELKQNANSGNLGSGLEKDRPKARKNSYIEPELVMVREMRANISMMKKMLKELKISDQVNFVKINLEKNGNKLKQIELIIEKELQGKELTKRETKFIQNFATKYTVTDKRKKELDHRYALEESIDGVDLLFLVYKKGDKKIIGAGPVFNYESK